ncbi:MAG: hypothetical protein LBU39_10905 [Desulfobulbaceae bacterium]|jgi:hypothetical protein|nr:hypothetical protein [Desulfobulbaceae bacterium]
MTDQPHYITNVDDHSIKTGDIKAGNDVKITVKTPSPNPTGPQSPSSDPVASVKAAKITARGMIIAAIIAAIPTLLIFLYNKVVQ